MFFVCVCDGFVFVVIWVSLEGFFAVLFCFCFFALDIQFSPGLKFHNFNMDTDRPGDIEYSVLHCLYNGLGSRFFFLVMGKNMPFELL